MREIDDPRLRADHRNDAVAYPDELVLEPVVGQEGDDRGARRLSNRKAGVLTEHRRGAVSTAREFDAIGRQTGRGQAPNLLRDGRLAGDQGGRE